MAPRACGMVQVSFDQVIDVVPMWYGFVAATRTVFVTAAIVFGGV